MREYLVEAVRGIFQIYLKTFDTEKPLLRNWVKVLNDFRLEQNSWEISLLQKANQIGCSFYSNPQMSCQSQLMIYKWFE